MNRLLPLFVLLGCGPSKQAQVRSLVDAGRHDLACAMLDEDARQPVATALAERSQVMVSMELVPEDAWPVKPQGYGAEWWVANLGIQHQGPAEAMWLDLSLPGYTHHPLTSEWLKDRWPEPEPDARAEPEIEGAETSSSVATGLWKVTKVIGALVFIPVAMTIDMTTALGDAGDGSMGDLPYLTPHLWRLTFDLSERQGPKSAPIRPTLARLDEGGRFECFGELCTTRIVLVPAPENPGEIGVRLDARSCRFDYRSPVPDAGGELAAVIGAIAPADGRLLSLELP